MGFACYILSESRIIADDTDFADFGVLCVCQVASECWVSLGASVVPNVWRGYQFL